MKNRVKIMKQHITVDEFYELEREQQRRLETWCFTHRYFTRLAVPGESARFTDTKTFTSYVLNPIELSIGQMIEFLDENNGREELVIRIHSAGMGWQRPGERLSDIHFNGYELTEDNVELCDALWEAVKEKANEK